MSENAHPAATHCDGCGCDWLDNGLNPVGCPYCSWTAEVRALREEVELWRHKAAIHKRHRERLAEALREAYGQVRELCGCYGLPYPGASFARYEALLRDEESRA